jgi:hypothetical protein
MTLEASLDATVDGNVVFDFHVTNAGDSAVELTFTSGQTADIVIYEEGDDEAIWRWSDGRMFTQAMETMELEPGAQFHKTYTWKTPRPGEYRARGTLEADHDADAETTFSVAE